MWTTGNLHRHDSESPPCLLRSLVTCLSVSMDGTLLLSGSHDETVRLWDVQSKQSLRCLNHKGKAPPLLNLRSCSDWSLCLSHVETLL